MACGASHAGLQPLERAYELHSAWISQEEL